MHIGTSLAQEGKKALPLPGAHSYAGRGVVPGGRHQGPWAWWRQGTVGGQSRAGPRMWGAASEE